LAALAALGHKLDDRGSAPVSLLMCGGAALNISGLLTRLTADVDVLGAMHANGELGHLPAHLHGRLPGTDHALARQAGLLHGHDRLRPPLPYAGQCAKPFGCGDFGH